MISGDCDNCGKDIIESYVYCNRCYDELKDDLNSVEDELNSVEDELNTAEEKIKYLEEEIERLKEKG